MLVAFQSVHGSAVLSKMYCPLPQQLHVSSIAGRGECSECSECICTVEPKTGLKYDGEFCECDPSICYSEFHKDVGNGYTCIIYHSILYMLPQHIRPHVSSEAIVS